MKALVRSFFAILIASFAVMGCSMNGSTDQASSSGILQPLNKIDTVSPLIEETDADKNAIARSRTVKVDFELATKPAAPLFGKARADDVSVKKLALNLFEDVLITVVVDKVEPKTAGNMMIIGHVEDRPDSSVILNIKEGRLYGDINLGEKTYQIRTLDNGEHSVREINKEYLDEKDRKGEDQVVAGDEAGGAIVGPFAPPPVSNDPVTIDLIVAYTAAARGSSSEASMRASIENAVAQANQVYVNSQVNQRVRLVHVYQTNYNESGDHLSLFRGTSDGQMDEIHSLRNQYGGDLAALIVSNASYCGQGYILQSGGVGNTSFAANAFSVTVRSCITNLSFVHELGHNMGAHHERAQSGGYPGATNYAYGYGNGTYRDVMAYNGGTRIMQFSSANIRWNNTVLGNADNDNSRALNITTTTMAGLKPTRVDGGGTTNQTPISNAGPDKAYVAGATVTLDGSASYDPENSALTYQWVQESGAAVTLSSATAQKPTFTTNTTGVRRFSLVVSDGTSSSPKDYVDITINAAPVAPMITTQPMNQTVTAGNNVSFGVVAAGTGPLSYQWHKNNVPLSGANGATLSLTNVNSNSAGAYKVVVSNSAGSVTSNTATLTVNEPTPTAPMITTQPTNKSGYVGGSVTFSVAASGSGPLSYQWYRDDSAIANATASSLTLNNLAKADAGNYKVKVSNAVGAIESQNATLTVDDVPAAQFIQITAQPVSKTIVSGSSLNLSVSARYTGSGYQSLRYQWYKDGVAISGQTGNSLYIYNTNLSTAGSYSVQISTSNESIMSLAAVVTVTPNLPVFRQQLQNQIFKIGSYKTLSAYASTANYTSIQYQWFKDGVAIPGQNSYSIYFFPVTASTAGTYVLKATSADGSVLSNPAVIQVSN